MNILLVRTAFDAVAGHICNLEVLKQIVYEIVTQEDSLEAAIINLETRLDVAEVTLRTDIRILINECRHIMTG